MLAAASHLSVSNFREAVIVLVRGNELYLAYHVSKLFYTPALSELANLISEKCEKYF